MVKQEEGEIGGGNARREEKRIEERADVEGEDREEEG